MAGYEVQADPEPGVWDACVEQHGHFLQYSGWGRLKDDSGWLGHRRIMVTRDGSFAAGAMVLYGRLAFGPMAYVPRGPFGPDLGAWPTLEEALVAEARAHNASFIKFEPAEPWAASVAQAGVRLGVPIQPQTTITLDLSLEPEQLLATTRGMTRRNVRRSIRDGVTVRRGTLDDLPAFYAIYEETADRDVFSIRPAAYYRTMLERLGDQAQLFLADHDGRSLAGIIVAVAGTEAVYVYGASSNAGRNLMPNYALQWHAIQWAKARGALSYDFWGVPDAVADDADASGTGGLWGVYGFKRGWGGSIVRRPGAFDLPLAPLRYQAWRAALALAERIRGRRGAGLPT